MTQNTQKSINTTIADTIKVQQRTKSCKDNKNQEKHQFERKETSRSAIATRKQLDDNTRATQRQYECQSEAIRKQYSGKKIDRTVNHSILSIEFISPSENSGVRPVNTVWPAIRFRQPCGEQ